MSVHAGSPSIAQPDYWWYRARSELLRAALERYVPPRPRLLDVGSADGPSVGWLPTEGHVVSLDIDPRGLRRGGVCGSVLELPFRDEAFEVVTAFDVIEHCAPEAQAMSELRRVLVPGGRLLASVPAYQWAWTQHDVDNAHHRRYTRHRLVSAFESAGLTVDRVTYAFASVFPFFAAERLARRLRGRATRPASVDPVDVVSVPRVGKGVETLLTALARVDRRLLVSRNLPFGSSVLIAASKPVRP